MIEYTKITLIFSQLKSKVLKVILYNNIVRLIMNTENKNGSSIRYILPILILSVGMVLIRTDVSLFSLSGHEMTTAGVALFALGAFTFIILINDDKNDIMPSEEIISLAHVLVIYASVLTMLFYEQIFLVETIIVTIFVMLMFGTGIALLVDMSNLGRFDVSK